MMPYSKKRGKAFLEDATALTKDGIKYRLRENDEKYKSCIPREHGRKNIISQLQVLDSQWQLAAEESRATKPYNCIGPYPDRFCQESYGKRAREIYELLLRRVCSGHISWDEFMELREYVSVRSSNIWALDPTRDSPKYQSWVDEVSFQCPTSSMSATSATTVENTTSTPTVTVEA